MTQVLVLRHGESNPLGLLGDALAAAGLDVREVMLSAGEPIPPLDDFVALVVMGGSMGAYDVDIHPWLEDEKRAVREAHARGLPMIGICLGGQLFADALGGEAYLAESGPEIGLLEPELTDEGRDDPVLRHLDRPVVAFHQDSWRPPPDAAVMARSDRFDHAFRLGSAVALQAHPEATPEIIDGWLEHEGARRLAEKAGVGLDDLRRSVRDAAPIQREMSRRLFGAWVEEVLAHVRAG